MRVSTGTGATLAVPCPGCAAATRETGPCVHPDRSLVAGVPIELGSSAAVMRGCGVCGLLFKHPFTPEPVLLGCYARSDADNWGHDPDPIKRRFDRVRALAERLSPAGAKGRRRVLDIGCSNGALLGHFGEGWERFGLEPSAAAAGLAARRGVTMLGSVVTDLQASSRFDVVLAVDVLEHLTDPRRFLAGVATHLSPGGVFIALTGDHDAWGWRLHGASYWYATLPEHQVFFNRRAIERLGAACGLTVAEYHRTSHARHRAGRVARDAVRGAAWGAMRRLGVFAGRPGPGWLPNRDHMLVGMRKAPGSAGPFEPRTA